PPALHSFPTRRSSDLGLRAIGHSIGLNIHEHPGLSYQSPLELKANMAFAVEPFITLNGHIPFQEAPEKYGLEDNVIVTPEGIEIDRKSTRLNSSHLGI